MVTKKKLRMYEGKLQTSTPLSELPTDIRTMYFSNSWNVNIFFAPSQYCITGIEPVIYFHFSQRKKSIFIITKEILQVNCPCLTLIINLFIFTVKKKAILSNLARDKISLFCLRQKHKARKYWPGKIYLEGSI